MRRKIIGLFICMLLITTAVPAVTSVENNTINSTVPKIQQTSATENWTEIQKLLASDSAPYDEFGFPVSLDEDTALIGVGGDDDNGAWSGSVYVFTRSGTTWTQQAKLLASDGAADDWFGRSVSLDGDTALIGVVGDDDSGDDSGSAYVFTRSGTIWTQQAKLLASDGAAGDDFGCSVALDGDTALIGALTDDDNGDNSGSAYVFIRTGTIWTQQAKLLASDGSAWDFFGVTVALDGDTTLIGAGWDDDDGVDSGSVYVFTRSGTTWTQQIKLTAADAAASDYFGTSIALDGDTAVIGAPYDDDNGDNSGSAYVFIRTGTIWTQQAKLLASDGAEEDKYSYDVDLDGDTTLIGAFNDDNFKGSAYVFTRTGNTWTQQAKLLASDGAAGDDFGLAVSLSSDTALIGAKLNDGNGVDSGSAYVFAKNQPPNTPTITGPSEGKVNVATQYNFTATDPDSDEVSYYIDWGDGNYCDWLGPYSSGQTINTSHSWSSYGIYEILVKAKDSNNQESNWSAPYLVYIYPVYSPAILLGVFVYYDNTPELDLGYLYPFFGLYIRFNPFDFKLYTPDTPSMIGIIFDNSTKKGVIKPDLIPYGYMKLGIIAGKFDAIIMPYY